MVGVQFTLPGAPQIYYGDEAGMWGGDDPIVVNQWYGKN